MRKINGPKGRPIQRIGSLKEETDNPKPNGALASDRGREGGTPVGLVALQ